MSSTLARTRAAIQQASEQRILETLLGRLVSLSDAGRLDYAAVVHLSRQLSPGEQQVLWELMNTNNVTSVAEAADGSGSDAYQHVSFAIATTLLCVCVIGIVLNAVSIYIYTRPSMAAPINTLLTALSAVDLALLALAIPSFVLPGMNTVLDAQPIHQSIYYTTLYLYPLTLIAQTCSVWLHVLITVERYVAVCHPFKALHKTSSRMRWAVCAVVSASVLYNIVRFFEYTGTVGEDGERQIDFLLRNVSIYYLLYYTALYLITHLVVPFALFVLLNTCVVRAILRARSNRAKLSSHQKGEHAKSFMMLIVTVIFAVCNSLTPVVNILELIDPDISESHQTLFFALNDTSIILVVLNSSTTALIYYHFSQRYRALFMHVLCGRCRPGKYGAPNRHLVVQSTFEHPVSTHCMSSRRQPQPLLLHSAKSQPLSNRRLTVAPVTPTSSESLQLLSQHRLQSRRASLSQHSEQAL